MPVWAANEQRISPMKLVMAIIKPFKLDAVRDALISTGVHGLTLTEVKGYGRQKGRASASSGFAHAVSFVPKIKIEVVAPDDQAESIVEGIRRAAWTGDIGDGKIFTLTADQALRIRTGETDIAAL
jgi:nitrogen regulatory protein P-II 2